MLAQTFGGWKCIVVDDGSVQNLDWVDSVDPRVHRIRQSNAGLSAARNRGIAESESEFVAFLDADDVWLPEKLSSQLDALKSNPKAVLCHTRMRLIDGDGLVTGAGWVRPIRSYEDLIGDSRMCVSSVIARRRAVKVAGGFDTRLQSTQDLAMWLALAKTGEFAFIDEDLVHYRVHEGNMSGNAWVMGREVRHILRGEAKHLRRSGRLKLADLADRSRRAAQNGWGAAAFDQARQQWSQEEYWKALSEIYVSSRLAPRFTTRQLIRAVTSKLYTAERNVKTP